MKRLALFLVGALVLAGCGRVSVESVPTGEAIVCDSALTGWWHVSSEEADAKNDDDETMHLHVSDDCARWTSVESDGNDESKVEDIATSMVFQIRQVGDARYLVVSDRDKSAAGKHDIGEGFEVFRYVVHADHIDLFQGDPNREAHRIADGWVAGRVESTTHNLGDRKSTNSVDTMITGDSDAIAEWLKRYDPIDRAFFELRRIDEKSRKRLDRYLKTPAPAGKPKPHE